MKNEIEESAFGYHERYRTGQDIVVGVNKFVEDSPEVPDILRVDPESEREQVERLKAFKADRDAEPVERRLEEIRETARGTGNLLPVLAPRSRTAARWARSAAPCATSSASTSRLSDHAHERCRLLADHPRRAHLGRRRGVRRGVRLSALRPVGDASIPGRCPGFIGCKCSSVSVDHHGLVVILAAGIYLASTCTSGSISTCSGASLR